MSISTQSKKRYPGELPTPQDLAKIFKKPRHDRPEILETYIPSHFGDMPPLPPLSNGMAPMTHSVPRDAVPILKRPYRVSDFFADYETNLGAKAQIQFNQSVQCYPPPKAPFLSREESGSRPGVMVPFVYPPLPAVQYDPLTNMPKEEHSDEEDDDGDENTSQDEAESYPAMAPLPFPPPNYMPYPLISEKAPPTPHEVFSKWLDASQKLPRVDMVVASAAGSIFDLHAEAGATGLTASKLQEMVRLGQVAESDPEAYDEKSDSSDASSEVSDTSYRNFMDYFEGIDTSSSHDPHATAALENVVVVESTLKNEYTNINNSNVRCGQVLQAEPTSKPSAFALDVSSSNAEAKLAGPPLLGSETEVTDATGKRKEHRREILAENLNRLESHFQENKDQIYILRKQELLERLHQLQSSEIHFDRSKDKIYNDDLRRYVSKRQAQNDEQLLGLKLSQNYEKLKTVLNYYQTSSRSYRTMNQVMINKLQKMKNFFEYQQQLLSDNSFVRGSTDPDAISIRNRDISKLYEGFVDQDYSNEIKEVFRDAVAKDDGVEKEDSYTLDPSLFRKVYVGHKHIANVHDFMPLVTKEEFRLVTGEAPSKLGPAKDPNSKGKGGRHQIFQSSLYDRVTSGSDTNGSDSGMVVKRRPGRRAAPKPTYGEEVAKNNNDAALVAKIMKQFIGPGAANAQELTEDLDLIGIQTKWPVK